MTRPAISRALALAITTALALPLGPAAALDSLRQHAPIEVEPPAPPLADRVEDDLRQPRAYPEQPPVIPHNIEGYEVSMNANRCLTCHSRQFTAMFQAPMISITHFMDRDNQILAAVSPRRYFCTQCHVPQTDAPTLIDNTFEDVDEILDRLRLEQAR